MLSRIIGSDLTSWVGVAYAVEQREKTCTCRGDSHEATKGLGRFNEAVLHRKKENLLHSGPMLRKIPRLDLIHYVQKSRTD